MPPKSEKKPQRKCVCFWARWNGAYDRRLPWHEGFRPQVKVGASSGSMKSRSVRVVVFFKAEYLFVVNTSFVADLSSDYKSNEDSFGENLENRH